MTTDYFEMEDDVFVDGRWHLNGLVDAGGAELDPRDFRYGAPIDLGPPLQVSLMKEYKIIDAREPLRVSLHRPGKPLDITFASFDMPVATARVAELFAAVAGPDIQRIPTQVESRDEAYEIINAIFRVDCIDTKQSEIQWFEERNDVRPDLVGKPEMITRLIIDPRKTGGRNVFRPEGWSVALIVSDVVKEAFEKARVTGVRFRNVC